MPVSAAKGNFRFGVITAYPVEDWHSARLIGACEAHGHVDVLGPADFAMRAGRVMAAGREASSWDAWLLPRPLGEAGDHDFQCALYQALAEGGALTVNPVTGLLAAEDKARTSWLLARAGIPTPPWAAAQQVSDAAAALAELGPAVVKPLRGSLGEGIERLDPDEPGLSARLAGLLDGRQAVYLQRWIPPRGGRARDLRLFVIGARVAAAMHRIAPPGEFRTNVRQGGEVAACEPDRACAAVAVRAAEALGLEYAGVDLVESEGGYTVIEVNGAPRWEGLLQATGRDMAEEIVEHAVAMVRRRENLRSYGR
jgi:tetrahydromethanopterin:alpha-L-glutamate ligase